jgi:beta-lactamase regulating signal transducer with metallopeptidase domain
MSSVVSGFVGWAANTFLLSALLLGFYYILISFQIKSTHRYSFLKITFLALPAIPALFQVFDNFFPKLFAAKTIVPTLSVVPSSFIDSASHPPMDSGTTDFWGWVILALLVIYLLNLAKGFLRISYSFWTVRKIWKHAERIEWKSNCIIYLHDYPIPPAAAGLFKPIILVSKNLAESLTDIEIDLVIRHESIHVDRKDPLFNAIRLVLKEVLIFSPFAYLLSKAFEEEMELSVDEILVEKQGIEKKVYGTLLLRLASQDIAPLVDACSGIFKSKLFIKRRLEDMKTIAEKRASMLFLIAMHLGFFSLSITAIPGLGMAEKNKVSLPLLSKQKVNEAKYCSNSSCSEEFKKELAMAVMGDAEAQNKVGEMLHFSRGVKQNFAEALRWYLKAVEKKHGQASNHIGRIYLNGEGVPKNAVEACGWYIKSGEWGHVWGMMNAASCYKYGNGEFPSNEAKAAEWYAMAEKAQPGVYREYEKILEESQKDTKESN